MKMRPAHCSPKPTMPPQQTFMPAPAPRAFLASATTRSTSISQMPWATFLRLRFASIGGGANFLRVNRRAKLALTHI